MIREILTLVVKEKPTQYYILFEKDRKRFSFQPTLKNREAPSFTIFIEEGEMRTTDSISEDLQLQAKNKINELLSNPMFDSF
jgi:hypothetical protein